MTTLNADFLFPDDIRNQTRMKGYAEAIGVMMSNLDSVLDLLKIYDLDNGTEAQLDAFANHFYVGGYSDAETESQKRALCKLAATLSRKSGTPWAIRTALETLGFTNVVIVENSTVPDPIANGLYIGNGVVQANGSVIFEDEFFEVYADNMTGNEEKAKRIILAYKGSKDYLSAVYNN